MEFNYINLICKCVVRMKFDFGKITMSLIIKRLIAVDSLRIFSFSGNISAGSFGSLLHIFSIIIFECLKLNRGKILSVQHVTVELENKACVSLIINNK